MLFHDLIPGISTRVVQKDGEPSHALTEYQDTKSPGEVTIKARDNAAFGVQYNYKATRGVEEIIGLCVLAIDIIIDGQLMHSFTTLPGPAGSRTIWGVAYIRDGRWYQRGFRFSRLKVGR